MEKFRVFVKMINGMEEVEYDKFFVNDCIRKHKYVNTEDLLAQFKYCVNRGDKEGASNVMKLLSNTVDNVTLLRLEENYGVISKP